MTAQDNRSILRRLGSVLPFWARLHDWLTLADYERAKLAPIGMIDRPTLTAMSAQADRAMARLRRQAARHEGLSGGAWRFSRRADR